MTKLTPEQQKNILEVTPWLRDGNQLLIQVTSVAESGLSRTMKVYAFNPEENHFNDVTTRVSDLLDLPRTDKGLRIKGVGMDMCFSLKNDLEGYTREQLGADISLNHKGFTSKETDFLMSNLRGMTQDHQWVVNNDYSNQSNKTKMLQDLDKNNYLRLANKDLLINSKEKEQTRLNNELSMYADKGDFNKVKSLVEQGADVNSFHNKAIKYASIMGNLEIVKYLVEQGANLNANDDEAIKCASQNGFKDIVKYLHQNGGDLDIAIKVADNEIKEELISYRDKTNPKDSKPVEPSKSIGRSV